MSIAQFIDHTILKCNTSLTEIEKLCSEAKQYNFASVCVPPYFVNDAKQILGSSVPITTVIGFPFGYSTYQAKQTETIMALEAGATEIDVVMNIAAFKNNDIAYLEEEINTISKETSERATLKVIIESGILTEKEIVKCCALYAHFPIDFLKTSTGYAEKGADINAVRIMKDHLPDHIRIKASGGIKTYEFAKSLMDAGASRLGSSAGVQIVKEENEANAAR